MHAVVDRQYRLVSICGIRMGQLAGVEHILQERPIIGRRIVALSALVFGIPTDS